MATSPNFNWPEPDNTDLVKNGALAIRTAVDAIDSSLVDLKGGITGQVLAKTSATDMDFTWSTPTVYSGPAFRAYRNSTQSISINTWTKVQFNAESYDTDNCFDPTTNYRFTPNKAGYYQINGSLYVTASGGTPATYFKFYKNGAGHTFGFFYNPNVADFANGMSDLIYMNGTTDYLEFYMYTSATSIRSVNGDASGENNYFTGVWIRS